MENLGNLLKEARQHKGLTQEELADRTNINLRTIQRIENGKNKPRLNTVRSLAGELGIELDSIAEHLAMTKKRSIGDLVAEGFFLLILNFVLMGIFGYLTLDSNANLNSKFAAVLLSFLIPIFIVYQTKSMNNLERTLKYGVGFLLYFILVMVLHGFIVGFGSLLFPCFAIALATLYYGKSLVSISE
ncbi:Helix-turn-helix [Muriicola jejuensis]|uniref:Helix-turn-helix domain-containing protein n=1 Tax=Muriicola jejuensis TaxID=504488 RepID=A0A6P0UGX5_9FLAO|nr:helix-turn-helix domain-containing protein [Muriicola jejuensis]NER10423.1 helix-turn-helix domain-containing protein [Muriicola jejuensis]SMP00867.1 Helix-turn-helix [Muriicola jejuensis]